MNNLLKTSILILSLSFIGSTGLADEKFSESAMLLQEALMESNGDYNKHKKKMNHEEFDRADNWSARKAGSITVNQRSMSDEEYNEYRQLQDEFNPSDREISSKYDETEKESFEN